MDCYGVTKVQQKNTIKKRISNVVFTAAIGFSPLISHASELTEQQQKTVIDNTLDVLQHSIYSNEQIAQLSRVLNKNLNEFNYTAYEEKSFFSQKLTKDIATKLGDNEVIVELAVTREVPSSPVASLKVQHALGEIAILDVDFNASKKAIDQAFRAIEKSDALILDVRGDDNGNLDMMRYFAGYLFADKTPLALLKNGKQETVSMIESEPNVAGKARPQLPIFILTNGRTAGIAESFVLALQQQRSAYIIGENSAGKVNVKQTKTVFDDIQLTYPVATVVEPTSQLAIEGIGIEPDLAVVSILSLKQALQLAQVPAIKYRVLQGRATPEEQYSINRGNIEYGDWQYAKGKCLVSYRTAEPRFNQTSKKYQFPYQVKYYGTGKSKVKYELGNSSGKMKQTVHFYNREDIKSGISIGFSSHLPLTIKRCQAVSS